jgi:hypothetical protein
MATRHSSIPVFSSQEIPVIPLGRRVFKHNLRGDDNGAFSWN